MTVQRLSGRFGPLIVVCLVGVIVGIAGMLVHGPTGLAWGLGWGLTASLGWAMLWKPRFALLQGLSAGLFVGVGLGVGTSALGVLATIGLAGLFWGTLGGLTAMLREPSVPPIGIVGFVALNFAGACVIGILGTIVTGLIGEILEGFSLSGAGFFIGVVFMARAGRFGTPLASLSGISFLLTGSPILFALDPR